MTTPNNTGFLTVDVYRFIVDWAMKHRGNTPSQRQIGDHLEIANSTAFYHIQALIKQGLLERVDGELCVARGIFQFVGEPYDMTPIKRLYPDITSMKYIPKTKSIRHGVSLSFMGIRIGEEADDQFNFATYPEGHYFQLEDAPAWTDGSHEFYFLYNQDGERLAILEYDPFAYSAFIQFV